MREDAFNKLLVTVGVVVSSFSSIILIVDAPANSFGKAFPSISLFFSLLLSFVRSRWLFISPVVPQPTPSMSFDRANRVLAQMQLAPIGVAAAAAASAEEKKEGSAAAAGRQSLTVVDVPVLVFRT